MFSHTSVPCGRVVNGRIHSAACTPAWNTSASTSMGRAPSEISYTVQPVSPRATDGIRNGQWEATARIWPWTSTVCGSQVRPSTRRSAPAPGRGTPTMPVMLTEW